jgi:TonB family protein
MPLILVVEPESHFVEHIANVLAPEGLQVEAVADQDRALQLAASRAPALVVVSTDVAGAERLFESFGHRRGGPGVVALVPERKAAQAAALGAPADAALVEPFSDQDLRLAVRRLMAAGRAGAPAADPAAHKLTSEEIFGDLLAELGTEPRRGQASPRRARALEAMSEAELDRKLEETLSGVLGGLKKPASPPAAPAAAAAPGSAATPTVTPSPAAAARRPRTGTPEVEELISRTLHDLELGRAKPRPAPAQPAPPTAPAATPPAAPIEPPRAAPPAPPPSRPPAAAAAEPARPQSVARPAAGAGTMPLPVASPASAAERGPSRAAATLPLPAVATPPPAPEPPALQTPPPAAAPPAAAPATVEAPSPLVTQRIPAIRPAAEPGGQQFGQYTLLERIAVGGMAEVWKARMRGMEGFQKTVAIKKILPHLTDNAAFVTMFIDEAKLAAQLNHPHITHIYDLGKIGEDYYIAMEYVEGRNLRALLNSARRKGVKVPLGLALSIGARLASALDYAHRKRGFDGRELGLVHRDVSPQNVLNSYEGDIKLCDFGIVKAVSKASHTQMGALKGKLQYMSPEQAWGKPVDGRSDLFSLGALLFETLTGRRLFPGDNEISVLEAVRECRVEGPRDLDRSIPPEVDALVRKALAKEPEERFQTAGAMQQAIESVLYSLRPAPSQADLAAFVLDLASAGPEREAAAEAEEPASGVSAARPGSRADLRSEPRPELPPELSQPRPALRREPTRPGEPAHAAPSEVAAVAAGRAGRAVELEEGGSRGRAWLYGAIAALLVVGLGGAGWVFRSRLIGGAAQEAGDAAIAAPPGQEAAAEAGSGSETAAEPGASAAGPAATAAGAEVPAGGEGSAAEARGIPPASGVNVTELLDAEMAKREQELKRKLDADAKRLEQQLAAAKASEEQRRLEEEQQRQRQADEAARREAEERAAAQAEEEARRRAEAERLAREQEEARRREEERQQAEAEAKRVKVGQLVAMGPGVTPPVLVSVAKPEYPPVARRLRVEGVVEVEVLVDENGATSDARIVKPVRQDVGLNEAALQAARTARFQPATKDGVRVKVWFKLRVPFQL